MWRASTQSLGQAFLERKADGERPADTKKNGMHSPRHFFHGILKRSAPNRIYLMMYIIYIYFLTLKSITTFFYKKGKKVKNKMLKSITPSYKKQLFKKK